MKKFQLSMYCVYLKQKKLVEVLTTHYYLLHEGGTRFTPLAQVIKLLMK